MKTLTHTQIIYIKNDLKLKRPASGFREELLDHMCSSIENKLNEGMNFADAYKLSLVEFTEQGFLELKNQSPVVKKKRRIIASQLGGATVAAMIFMMVLGVEAQDPPSRGPLDNEPTVTMSYGPIIDPFSKEEKHHFGMDFRAKIGTPVVATANGTVIEVNESNEGYGNKIVLKHDNEFKTLYAHLNEIKVSVGQEVKIGEIIGLSGNTGKSTGPHLHYEVIKSGKRVNPSDFMGQSDE